MCGRIKLRATPAELQEFFDLFREPVWSPRYNLGPMQQMLVVRQKEAGRVADSVQWGLVPVWAKDPKIGSKMINARGETVADKPSFRSAFIRRRCLIPASGFYEWQQLDSKTKQPWNIVRSDGLPLVFAGLWEQWKSPLGEVLESCTIITTEANQFMAEIHDRMPVILGKECWDAWLDCEGDDSSSLHALLVPCPNDWLMRTAVSTYVNNIRNESPMCIQPLATGEVLRNDRAEIHLCDGHDGHQE